MPPQPHRPLPRRLDRDGDAPRHGDELYRGLLARGVTAEHLIFPGEGHVFSKPSHNLLAAIRRTPYKLYLLIDEYDNFANEVMTADPDAYQSLVHADGPFNYLFKWVKAATAGQGLDRLFITGVSPVVMSDVTSGLNIARSVFGSYLYYFGMLTLIGETPVRSLLLAPPNPVMQGLYVDQVRRFLLPLGQTRDASVEAKRPLVNDGKIEPLLDFIAAALRARAAS